MKKGFTLVEILIAVMIVVILVAMALPMYEKTIEKSRMAEARTMLKRLYESKTRLMDDMDKTGDYQPSYFGFENLDYTIRCSRGYSTANNHKVKCATKDFTYVLNPTGKMNFVCAARRSGDNAGVNLLYEPSDTSKPVKCNNGSGGGDCEAYGYDSETTGWCTSGVDVVF